MEENTKVLLVASTEIEVVELQKKLTNSKSVSSLVSSYRLNDINVDILISGIGIPQVMFQVTKWLSQNKYDLVMNVGICGSFSEEYLIGDTVSVIMDQFADIGIRYPDSSFKTLFEEELLKPNAKPFKNGKLYHTFEQYIDTNLPKVTSITVNTTSGNISQIKERKEKFDPDIETMEGAAVAFICLSESLNFLQIRTVSNMVEARNKANWDIELAVKNLADTVIELLISLNIKQASLLV